MKTISTNEAKVKKFRYLDNTTTLQLNEGLCLGCGNCVIVCPHRVFQLIGKKAVIHDLNGCMECGACSINCPAAAISVQPGVGCAEAYINRWISGITGKKTGNTCC